jgi:hypothetical protein
LQAAYHRKSAGILCATALFITVLAYGLWLRDTHVATASVTLGHVAGQWGEWGPTNVVPVERLEIAERHLRQEVVPALGLQDSCFVEGRVPERIFVSCSAKERGEAARRTTLIVDALIARHAEMFKRMLTPIQEKANSEKLRLELMLQLQESARSEPDKRRIAIETGTVSERLAANAKLRNIDRATTLETGGIVVNSKRFTPLMLLTTLILSLAFGAFVSLALAAASTLSPPNEAGEPKS